MIATEAASRSAVPIRVPNIFNLMFGNIGGKIMDKLEAQTWYHWQYWHELLYAVGVVLTVYLIYWFYMRFIR